MSLAVAPRGCVFAVGAPTAAQRLVQAHMVGAEIGLVAMATLSCVLSRVRWVSSTVWKSINPLL